MNGVTGDIESGAFEVTFAIDSDDDASTFYTTSIYWDQSRRIEWATDIAEGPGLSPGSSAPIFGTASWLRYDDVLVAYMSYDAEMEGWVRIPNAAPGFGSDDVDEAVLQPDTWVQFARTIARAIGGHLPDVVGESY